MRNWVLSFKQNGEDRFLRVEQDGSVSSVTKPMEASCFHSRSEVMRQIEKFKNTLAEWGATDLPANKNEVKFVKTVALDRVTVGFDGQGREIKNLTPVFPTCVVYGQPPQSLDDDPQITNGDYDYGEENPEENPEETE